MTPGVGVTRLYTLCPYYDFDPKLLYKLELYLVLLAMPDSDLDLVVMAIVILLVLDL